MAFEFNPVFVILVFALIIRKTDEFREPEILLPNSYFQNLAIMETKLLFRN